MASLNLAKVTRSRRGRVRLISSAGAVGSVRREKRETLLEGLSRFLTLKRVRSREKSHAPHASSRLSTSGLLEPSTRPLEESARLRRQHLGDQ
jgi:hypothetical protein